MTMIVGHRGAMGHATENTIPSFLKAIELGAHMTELDVFMSRDHEVVVFHDDNLSRLCGVDRFVENLTVKELKRYKVKQTETIPTLQEVINVCRGKINLMIELKGPGTGVPVLELLEKNDLMNDVIIVSFKPGYLKQVFEVNREVKLGLLVRHYSNFFLNNTAKRVWKSAEDLELDYLGPRSHLVNRKIINEAHSRGIKAYSYAVRDLKLGKRLIDWGIDALITDNPEWFL